MKVLLAGHDWGGLNVLVPLARAWSADPRIVPEFLAAPAVRRDFSQRVPGFAFAPNAESLTEWMCFHRSELDSYLDRVLTEGGYQAVVCGTSAHALLERRLIATAHSHGIPTIALCDMWWAYAERFQDNGDWTLPDILWVLDEPMRQAATSVPWPRSLRIEVIGSPLFCDLAKRRAAHLRGDARALRFISEPASTKFPEARIDEFETAELLLSTLKNTGLDLPFVIRPHPADGVEAWRRWVHTHRDLGVELETLPIDEALKDTRMAVGLTSILLAEMRMCGIPVASIQLPRTDRTYFCLPFEELGIKRLESTSDITLWLHEPGPDTLPAPAAVHLGAIEAATTAILKLAQHIK